MGQWIMRKGPIGTETNMIKETDRQTDRQTDTIEGRKAAFQGVQSVTRGEIASEKSRKVWVTWDSLCDST